MSEDFLSADIRKKLREFELQVQFTCPGMSQDAPVTRPMALGAAVLAFLVLPAAARA